MKEGATLGPYVVRRHLGDGGMGSVWLADDTRLNRRVALKTLRAARAADTAGRERLLREARAFAALNHPNIAAVYDVLESDGDVAIVLEYVDGRTLAEELSNGRWPFARAIDAALQLAKALRAAHAHGVVHRDLKPSNVILGADGLKVLDFGIARLLPIGTTVTTGIETTSGPGFIGTPAYAAPEQLLSSAVDERADLYALGVILFEMVAGQRPFPGHDTVSLTREKLGRDAPALSDVNVSVPAPFESLVGALLKRDPARRPSSANDVVRALEAITGETATGLLPAPRARTAWWAAAALALAVTIAAAVLAIPRPQEPTPNAGSNPVVAVLPLRNTSDDPSKDFLAAGLSENLIASLASTPSLIVLSRAAVAEAVKEGADTSRALKALGASFVIDGSVQQSGIQLRVAINLVRADQAIAWGGTFDGTIDRVFDLQTRMALAVSEAMAAGRPVLTAAATTNPAALEAYWRGRTFLDRWDVKGNVDAAIAALTEATAKDPRFAIAHAATGVAYWRRYTETRDQQFAQLSIDSGTRAAALNPNLPEVRLALAVSLAGTGRVDEAINELHAALQLRPTFDEARRQLGLILSGQGKIDQAVPEFQKAIALRPRYWAGYNDLGGALFAAGRHAEAAKAFEKVVELQPDSYIGLQQLGLIYQTVGDEAKAIDAYQRSIAIRPSLGAVSNLGTLYHVRGDYPRAVDAYERAITLQPGRAATYRNLGDSLHKMGRPADAERAYLKAVERAEADLVINPADARTFASLAVYLAKAGRAAEAHKRIARARELSPNDAQVRYRSAVVNVLTERLDDSLNDIAAAIEQGYSVRAVQDEEDFAAIRSTPRFVALITPSRER